MMSLFFYVSAISSADDGIWTGLGSSNGVRYNVKFIADSKTRSWTINYGIVGGAPNYCGGYWELQGVNRFREVITYGSCMNVYCNLIFTGTGSTSNFLCSPSGTVPYSHAANLTRLYKFC
ncbi:unnamed protein product [Adineta steineri]|uniref:Uncharacterized protein n=1 Tax=Adineta steineri TaxID=433720 RepID=A0A818JUW5_9BILA|nr:unnamed protein product [Adineta steineri]